MLTISDTRAARTCQGATRREFLRVGGLGLLGGLGLPDLLAARARAATEGRAVKDKAVVLLFLQGGPSHIEFFDPKMSAPEEVRSITGEVQTRLPGVTFGGSFTKLARMTDKIAVVRSYASMNAGHTYLSVTRPCGQTVGLGNKKPGKQGIRRLAAKSHYFDTRPAVAMTSDTTVHTA